MGSILSIGCLTGLPRLDVRDMADAQADRALAESGRHTLDNVVGRSAVPRPSAADVKELARRAARRVPKLPPLMLPAVPALSAFCH